MRETQGRVSHRGPRQQQNSKNWLAAVGQSPWLWGSVLTVGFYQLIPYLPVERELAQRYFCSHPLENVIGWLFFLGLAILLLKSLRLATEKSALNVEDLRGADLSPTANAEQMAAQLEDHLATLPSRWQDTYLVRRMKDVCAYVTGRRSAEGLEDHLKYLTDQAYDRAHESYGLIRTVNWAVPIVGFLGTVVGITLAIANVSPEQLDTSLKEVTGGLAIAFDTTALSLSLTLILVFFYFVVERSEQQILARVEDFGSRRLACLFPVGSSGTTGTLADVQHHAAKQLLEKTEAVINWQTELWQDALEALRTRWTQTLADQQSQWDQSLQRGMSATLLDHAQQLQELRDEFVDAFRQISHQVQKQIAASQDAQTKQMAALVHVISDNSHQAQEQIAASQDAQTEQMAALVSVLSDKTTHWQNQLQSTTTVMQQQLGELRDQKAVLLQVVSGEEELARLQGRLTENLEAVRAAEVFEQTLHSLNAAVHLLTARNRPHAA